MVIQLKDGRVINCVTQEDFHYYISDTLGTDFTSGFKEFIKQFYVADEELLCELHDDIEYCEEKLGLADSAFNEISECVEAIKSKVKNKQILKSLDEIKTIITSREC